MFKLVLVGIVAVLTKASEVEEHPITVDYIEQLKQQ